MYPGYHLLIEYLENIIAKENLMKHMKHNEE